MCTTCGCGSGEVSIEGKTAEVHAAESGSVSQPKYRHHRPGGHWHRHADGTWHSHVHGASALDAGAAGPFAAVHSPELASARRIQIEEDILAKNDAVAAENRRVFADHAVF